MSNDDTVFTRYCDNCGAGLGNMAFIGPHGAEYCSKCADGRVQVFHDGPTPKEGSMTEFETGATRSAEEGKLDPEGFLHPAVLRRYCQYLNKHRVQADGKLRDSDNWQKGMPIARYVKSLLRHVFDVWMHHRGQSQLVEYEDPEDCICAAMFNAQGLLLEKLIERGEVKRNA